MTAYKHFFIKKESLSRIMAHEPTRIRAEYIHSLELMKFL